MTQQKYGLAARLHLTASWQLHTTGDEQHVIDARNSLLQVGSLPEDLVRFETTGEQADIDAKVQILNESRSKM